MTTMTPETVQWMFAEVDAESNRHIDTDKVRYRWMVWSGVKTEVAITIAVALKYQIKGGEA